MQDLYVEGTSVAVCQAQQWQGTRNGPRVWLGLANVQLARILLHVPGSFVNSTQGDCICQYAT